MRFKRVHNYLLRSMLLMLRAQTSLGELRTSVLKGRCTMKAQAAKYVVCTLQCQRILNALPQNLPENQCIFVRGYRVIRGYRVKRNVFGVVRPEARDPDPDKIARELEKVSTEVCLRLLFYDLLVLRYAFKVPGPSTRIIGIYRASKCLNSVSHFTLRLC